MKLLTLRMENFKGIKDLTINFNGADTNVYGQNATGKTTVFDAFTWLLFGKNSDDANDFGIKTRDEDGVEIPRIEHSVEATIEHKGENVVLKRVYKENWSKMRGAAEATYTGNTTNFYVGGGEAPTPMSAAAYKKYISTLIDEKLFKLLTSPTFFNEKLTWQERRQIISQACGTITDAEVIAANADLAELSNILGNRTVDDTILALKTALKNATKDRDNIKPRIDENHKLVGAITPEAYTYAYQEKYKLAAEISELQKKIAEAKAGNAKQELYAELEDVRAKMADIKALCRKKYEEECSLYSSSKRIEEESFNEQKRIAADLSNEIEKLESEIKKLEVDLQTVSKAFDDVRVEEFEENAITTVCPTCGQDLPAERVEQARSALKAEQEAFAANKAERLKAINDSGKALKTKLGEKEGYLDLCKERLSAQKEKIAHFIKIFEMDCANVPKLSWSQEVSDLEAKEALILKAIATPSEGNSAVIDSLNKELAAKQAAQDEAVKKIALGDVSDAANKRINELLAEEKKLTESINTYEAHLFLCSKFIKTKSQMVNDMAAAKFKKARFVMFKSNISNDGLQECCETTYLGVPYSDLNSAARINIGIDIINTLQAQYGVTAPIIVDNAESVVELEPTEAQVIRLVVSEKDKTLRIEEA